MSARNIAAVERRALKIYDRLNPDWRRKINVSKAKCLKIARLELKREGLINSAGFGPGIKVKPNNNFEQRHRTKPAAGIIERPSSRAAGVWYVRWDGYRTVQNVPETWLALYEE